MRHAGKIVGRLTEVGVLLNVAKSSFDDYASWARQSDLDSQLTSSNSCPVFTISYDIDPSTGTLSAYDERRGSIARRRYYSTVIDDQPTNCPGRGASDPVNERLFQYDDLSRTTLLSEHRQSAADDVYRTTGLNWPNGGILAQLAFPDQDHAQAFDSSGQGSLTVWPDILGRSMRVCAGQDCSGVVYSDVAGIDWTSSPLSVLAGNGVGDVYSYDLRGAEISQSSSLDGEVLFAETLRDMQIADGENPCAGSTSSPDYSAGLLIARALSGTGLPQEDQGVWDCYEYDGALRLTQSSRYQSEEQAWVQSSAYGYGFDDNGNVHSITGTASASFARSGKDQVASASLASGEAMTFAYDDTYGQMTSVSSGSSGYSLSLEAEPLLHLPLSQTIVDNATGATLLSAAIDYEANGLRSTRTVRAGSQGAGSSTTYWYGGALHPLVVERDGVNYRLIGKGVVEQIGASDTVTRSYLYADHLGSVRIITDDQGRVTESLGYDGDWGSTRIAGQTYAASDDDVASLYRFQGQEQETFPLSTLNINDSALAAWLDEIGFYHYPWRGYAAGFAAFAQTDPIPAEDSPYRAFGSNPANYVDETGGMWEDDPDPYPRTYNPLPRGLPRRIKNMLVEIRNDPRMMDEDRLRTGRHIYEAILSQRNNPHNPFDNYPVVVWDETSNKERIELREVSDEAEIDEALRRFQVLRDEQYEWLGIYSRVLWPEWYPESNRPIYVPNAETNVPQSNQSNAAQQRRNEVQEEKTDSEEDDHDAKKCCVM